ncbi:phage baseplate assembly protein [Bosea sp. BK604]|uniref:phage baseplate assembly protein domain-containing protein n=1 Tax=Bosea sp. BK604 TaxID=2512180 RepID=UPI00104B90FC|nr:phage baseplate assembly protein [Bosea sp. BK604]TCR69686.1 bacteriophage Mu Gp45 protein [Bosea sp. BK604]
MPSEFWAASELSRGKLSKVDDSGDGQFVDFAGYRGESFTKVLRPQPHGFSSHPPADAVGIFMRHGSSDRLSAIGFETPSRPRSIPAGTAVLYDAAGNLIFAKGGEGVRLTAAQGGVTVTASAGNVLVESTSGTITLKRGGMVVIVSDTRIDLGGPGGQRVATEAGFSNKVFAIL